MPSSPYLFKSSRFSSHTAILDFLPPAGNGQAVLDLGCSQGYLDSILLLRGFRVTGIDLPGSDWSQFPKEARALEADLDCGLPHLGETFRFAVCADVLEHLKDPVRLLGDLRRTLNPDGVLVASLPNSGHLYFRLTVLSGRFPAHDRGLFDRTHLHFYTWSGWKQLFESCGFEIAAVRPTTVPFDFAFPNLAGSVAVQLAERITFECARLWKKLFAYQFIVLARPSAAWGAIP